MMRFIFIILCLTVAGVIAFSAGGVVWNGTTDPLFKQILLPIASNGQADGLTKLLAERNALNEALANANRLKVKIAQLEEAEKGINPDDLARLDKFIPDHIDNINLIIDVNNIAARHEMSLKDVKVKSDLDSARTVSGNEPAGASQDKIAEANLSFSVKGSYQDLLSFLDDLATSLRVADVTSLSFSVDEKGVNQYNFEIKTYWVK